LAPGVGILQVREESPSSGVSVPVHEKPNESPVHPVTLESALHVVDVNWMQQYSVRPLSPAVGSLHTSDESLWSGLSPFPQEYPVDGLSHPTTLESCAQPSDGEFGVTLALAVHPRSPKTHPVTTREYRFMVRVAQASGMPATGSSPAGLLRAASLLR
jgi:hypothetical protein